MDHDLEPHEETPADATYEGPERRDPHPGDRRTFFRGSRRATDALKMAAGFVYSLLTEPPR